MARPVIVISSINKDTTLTVPYFPTPGETLHSEKATTSLGGKGANVAIAAAHATKSVCLVGAIGPDGLDELATLDSHNVHTDYIKRTETPTGSAVILVNPRGENCIVVSKGANALVQASVPPELERMMCGALVVLQLEIEHGVTQALAVMADRVGATVVFNPSPAPTASSELFGAEANVWKAAGMVVLNAVEVEQICGVGLKRNAVDMMDAWGGCIEEIRKRCREGVTVVLTLGEVGVVYSQNGLMQFVSAVEVDCVVDTTGAGDTFTGFVVAGLAEGRELDQCIRMAVTAAALCVGRWGAAESIPTMEEVEQKMGLDHSSY